MEDLDQKVRKSRREDEVEVREVEKHLVNEIMEDSTGPIEIQNVFVSKKSLDTQGRPEIRSTGYYCKLNHTTKKYAYPIENMDNILEWLAKKKVFSSVDMRDGYWNILLRKSDRYLTAIKTGRGLVLYTRMGMGLKNAGPLFQRVMERMFDEFLWEILTVYKDDLNVGIDKDEEHVEAIGKTLERLQEKS